MKQIIAIDPGASGGIAWVDNDGIVQAAPMPDGMTTRCDFLRDLHADVFMPTAIIEDVGKHVQGNNAQNSATFAAHCESLKTALYMIGIPFEEVPPKTWQAVFSGLPKAPPKADHNTKERVKRERKNAIKEKMARIFPHLAVTLKTADALGILYWAMKEAA